VRIKRGRRDPDYPDIPLGGWVGVIQEVDTDRPPPRYLVAWTPETLAGIPPIYLFRCDRDGYEVETSWLPPEYLEPDPGGPPEIEPPGQLRPRPLRKDDSDDRVRRIFGLTSDDPLPPLNKEVLQRWYDYLRQKLRLPLPILLGDAESFNPKLVQIVSLEPPDEESSLGLLVQVADGDAIAVLPLSAVFACGTPAATDAIADYAHWLRQATGEEEKETSARYAMVLSPVSTVLAALSLALVMGGAPGAMLGAFEGTRQPAQIGAAVVAILGLLTGTLLVPMKPPAGAWVGYLMGRLVLSALIGAWVGAVGGMLFAEPIGPIAGALLGTLVGWLGRKGQVATVPLPAFGAALGGIVVALGAGLLPALLGLGLGSVAGVVFVILLFALRFPLFRRARAV
jgi:hypothetical protein